MDAAEYQNIADNEASHFFYVAVHELILKLVKKFARRDKSLQILDAGCGTGTLAQKMKEFGHVIGFDQSEDALAHASRNGIQTVKGSVEYLPFESNTFDLVTSVDVLYHEDVKDDVKAMREFNRVIKPGGILIIRLPAHDCLFSNHDRLVRTARRYSPARMRKCTKEAGFTLLKLTQCQWSLFFPALVKAKLDATSKASETQGKSAIGSLPFIINNSIKLFLQAENYLLMRGLSFPFGIGLVCVCRKD